MPKRSDEENAASRAVRPTTAKASPAELAEQQASPTPAVSLRALMALEEPARTAALEEAVDSGTVFYLKSTSGKPVRQSFGDKVLEVTSRPRPFLANHAIHLLWHKGTEIVEVSEAAAFASPVTTAPAPKASEPPVAAPDEPESGAQ